MSHDDKGSHSCALGSPSPGEARGWRATGLQRSTGETKTTLNSRPGSQGMHVTGEIAQHLERPLLGKPGMGVEEGQLAAVVRLHEHRQHLMRRLSLNRPEPGQKSAAKKILKNCETLLCSFLGRHPNDRVTSDPGVFSSTLPPAHNPTRPGRVTSLTPFDYRQLSRCRRHVQQRRPGQRIGVVANMRRIDPLQHDCARIVIYGDDSGRHAAK